MISVVLTTNPTTSTKDNYYPSRQSVSQEYLSTSNDYIYSTDGQLMEIVANDIKNNRFFVKVQNIVLIEIELKEDDRELPGLGAEIGYLARILSSETLTSGKMDNAKRVSMFARVCVAETIKNRKKSELGFFAKYRTYRDVIKYTGYATNLVEYYDTQNWLKSPIAFKRFTEEVLPAAIFVFFNNTNFTNNAIGFYTPAQMREGRILDFAGVKSYEISGIDPYYEFTFWKF